MKRALRQRFASDGGTGVGGGEGRRSAEIRAIADVADAAADGENRRGERRRKAGCRGVVGRGGGGALVLVEVVGGRW